MSKGEMKVVALGQQKGGVGKSAAAINLACQAVAAGHKAAIVDLDSEQGTTRKWRERRNGTEQPSVVSADASSLDAALEALRGQGVEWVFLDLPGRAAHVASAGFKGSHLVLIPCRPLDVDVEASFDTIDRVRRAKVKYAYLMNIAPGNQDKARARQVAGILRAHGHTVADAIIVQRIEVPDGISAGQGVNEFRPKSESNKEFAELFAWIKKETEK